MQTTTAKKGHTPDAGGTAASRETRSNRAEPSSLDNQSLQALLANGAIHAKLTVGAADDPLERQADNMAERALRRKPACDCGKPDCGGCSGSEDDAIQRKPKANGRAPKNGSHDGHAPDHVLGRLGSGSPLGAKERSRYEPAFGADLGAVRIHDGPAANGSASEINARAFTAGNDIAFAAGQYQPDTDSGERLLAHELSHVMQGSPKIHREFPNASQTPTNESESDEATSSPEADPGGSSNAEWSFDPYAEDVTALTNLELVTGIHDTEDWLAENTQEEPDHSAHEIRDGRLEVERVRRIGMGHMWLTTVHERMSYPLYQLIQGANGATDVVAVENDDLINGVPQDFTARPIMTQPQFEASMQSQGVRTVTVDEYQAEIEAIMGAGESVDPLAQTYGVSGATSGSSTRYNLTADAFASQSRPGRSGGISQAYALSSRPAGYGFNVMNRDAMSWEHPERGTQRGNYPVSDQRTFLGDYPPEWSVKSRMAPLHGPPNPSAIATYRTYLEGYAQMLNMAPGYRGFGHFSSNAGAGRTDADIRSRFGLVVSADDVAGLQQLLSDPLGRDLTPSGEPSQMQNYQRAEIERIYNGLLRDRPVQPADGGTPLTTVAEVVSARDSGRLTDAEFQQHLGQTGQSAAGRVYANPDYDLATQMRFDRAFYDIDESLRPQMTEARPILHSATRNRASAAAGSRSQVVQFSNYLDRLTAVVPQQTGALHVDADDAPALQQLLRDPLGRDTRPGGGQSGRQNFQRAGMARVYDAVLQRPQGPHGHNIPYNTVADLHAAFEAGTVTAPEYSAMMHRLGRLAANEVQPRTAEVTQAHDARMAEFRQATRQHRASMDLANRAISSRVTPEYMSSVGHGGGWRGDLRAARGYGGRGALFSGLLGAGQEIAMDGFEDPERIVAAGVREALRGGSTTALETIAASQVSRRTLQAGLGMGATRALALKLGARFGPGAIIEPAFAGAGMLMDDRPNSGEEVGYTLSRAFVIGGSSALAASLTTGYVAGAIGTAVFPGVGTVVGFVAGLIIGAIVGGALSYLFPSYEDLVREAVPLQEFENNIQAQSPRSLQNQVFAQQEYDLLEQLREGPDTRGPYHMQTEYDRRNRSRSPGDRFWAEALINDQIHGGCADCHTRIAGAALEGRTPWWSESRLSPLERMSGAALDEFGNPRPMPQFLDYDMPRTQVDAEMMEGLEGSATAEEMATYINMVAPNIGAWEDVLGPNASDIIPRGAINLPMDEFQLYDYMQAGVDANQAQFERHFGPVSEHEYEVYRTMLEAADEPESSSSAPSTTSQPFSSPIFTCFAGNTPVRMADGSEKAIENIAIGDQVLSYNESTQQLEARSVKKVHDMPPAAVLRLQFANGATVLVTPTHKLSTPQGWRAVADLAVGDAVLTLGASNGSTTDEMSVTRLEAVTPAGVEGRVYDLSVDTTHTYFASHVLAHNKLP